MNKTEQVKEMYDKYPFPGIENFIKTTLPEKITVENGQITVPCIGISHLPEILYYLFNGYWDKKQTLRVLFAGGGTGQHTYWLAKQLEEGGYQYEIVHLELSSGAIEKAKTLLNSHNLNISFINDSITELDKHDLDDFDYIDCYGVLHHTPDPLLCLKKLTGKLKDNGGMGIMLYGKYGRKGIYPMQNVMKLFDNNLDEKIDVFKELLPSIPKSNPFYNERNAYLNNGWSSSNENIVDTILHVHDVAFTVDDVYKLCNDADVELVDFCNSYMYKPEYLFSDKESKALENVGQLSIQKQQSFCELFENIISRHDFFIKKRINNNQTIMNYNDNELKDMVPIKRLNININGAQNNELRLNFNNCDYYFGKLPLLTKKIMDNIDNKRNLDDIYNLIKEDMGNVKIAKLDTSGLTKERFMDEFGQLFDIFNSLGWLMLNRNE